MQIVKIICCLLLFAAATFAQTRTTTAPAHKSYLHPQGFYFQYPADWRIEANGQATQILPPGLSADDQTENIRLLTEASPVEATDPRFVVELDKLAAQLPGFTKVGAAQNYQTQNGTGLRAIWAGKNFTTRQPIQMRVYATTVNGLAVVLFAAGAVNKLDAHETQFRAIAASVRTSTAATNNRPPKVAPPAPTAPASTDHSPLAQQWMQKLNGKKLTFLSSYNSGGGGGGMSSKTEIYLLANGTFQVRSESSVSIYVEGANGGSGGVKRATGTWRIYARNGQAILETKYENGQIESSLLENRNGQTFVNGKRWFVTEQ